MLTGKNKMALRKLVNDKKPAVTIGGNGLSEGIISSLDTALNHHEVIKIKFTDFKEKEVKLEILATICEKLKCDNAGMIGHTAVLYRQNEDEEKRKVKL